MERMNEIILTSTWIMQQSVTAHERMVASVFCYGFKLMGHQHYYPHVLIYVPFRVLLKADQNYSFQLRQMIWSFILSSDTRSLIMRPRQDGRYYPCDIFKSMFCMKIAVYSNLIHFPKSPFNNKRVLVQIITWLREGAMSYFTVCFASHDVDVFPIVVQIIQWPLHWRVFQGDSN